MLSSVAYHPPKFKNARIALYTGATSALLASTCHHISYLLITFGVSSTKILYIVTLTDWARPFLVIVALISLFISYKNIWHISFSYKSGRDNEIARTMMTDKFFFLSVTMLVIIILMLPYFAPCTEWTVNRYLQDQSVLLQIHWIYLVTNGLYWLSEI